MNPNKRRSLQKISVSLAALPRWLPPAIAAVSLPRHAQATPLPLCSVTDLVGDWLLQHTDMVFIIALFDDGTGTYSFTEPLTWALENDVVVIQFLSSTSQYPPRYTGRVNANCNEINGTEDGGYSFRAVKLPAG